jgi:regulatory protein
VGPARALDLDACREAALRLLERTRRTRSDLMRRLRDKGYDPAVIGQVIERLAGVGLIDDVEYARAYLAGRWGRRAAGWRVLENDLRRRGVSPDDIAAARAGFELERGGVDELAGALRAIEQAARRYVKLEPRVRRQRLWGMLARKGFDGETIEAALRMSEARRGRDEGG